ncbi:MAG: mannose-1-phosphate guanylyltransferase/mannose-6-phosphate isomerase [Legionellales bacterium]|nr:mannose-1-phosphate guanylyltransferase/mannose-6-phosphate isomerase [Legionellales bacterium]
MIIPVLLSGGIGSRLWPMSRQNYPKQFLPLVGEESLFQMTLRRLKDLPGVEHLTVVARHEHRFLIAEQLRKIDLLEQTQLILEPEGKNTAPAVALAAFYAQQKGWHDAQLLVLPADHLIEDTKGFHQTVAEGIKLAESSHLVTFGVKPSRAETGYGYIEAHENIEDSEGFKVKQFTEKPSLPKAQAYMSSGCHWWNSGMFLFNVDAYLKNLEQHSPDIYHAVSLSVQNANVSADFISPDSELFHSCPSDSIDYAIMEKSTSVAMVPLKSNWCDVGSWSALSDQFPADENYNVQEGKVFLQNCKNTYVKAESRLVAAVGIENVVIVETPDAILVMDKSQDQCIKHLIEQMKRKNQSELAFHRKVHRPWGAFESLDTGARYQVKRIAVKPGAQLSLQMHHHRSEHWVVVKGSARVTRGTETFLLTENQSTYIPIGTIHRLENVGRIDLEIIEVQSGSYLGEDDIIRLEDNYGRQKETAVVDS